ncbi:PAP/fibrillin family protein [Altererythrobacter sp. GH1-8]|uniref:PAP/fibrillin family protein n=1 Tax=Altererythrobacter sp. GH1-8 TaxID=3349333 RepID=UPI00374D2E22
MTEIPQLKAELRAAIDSANPNGTYEEGTVDRIHELMQQLADITPMPRPIDEQDKVAGPWASYFAQFGPKHTAGKPIEHETSMKLLSFNKFPDAPIRMLEIEQEIHHESKDYNNVQVIENIAGTKRAHFIVYGRYDIAEETPQRYQVEFYKIALVGLEGESDDELRESFGLAPDTPLEVEMKPPKLHSDVVFCDDDMRINFGSMGGAYVMNRSHHSGYSVRFS